MIEVLTQPFVEELADGRRRPRALWRILAQYVIFFALTVVLLVPATLLLFALRGFQGGALQAGGSGGVMLASVVASLLAAFATLWLAGRFLDRRRFADYGLRLDGGWWLDLGFGLALGAALMAAIFVVQLSMGWVSVTGTLQSGPGAPFWISILTPVALFLCVGIYEELIFRGYQIKNASEGLGGLIGPRAAILVAWLITSSMFAVAHIPNPNSTLVSTTNIALAGLMLGAGYVLTGKLAIPIGLHISWNLFQASVFGFPVSGLDASRATFIDIQQSGPEVWTGGEFGPEAGLLTIFATVLGVISTLLWTKLRGEGASLHLPLAERPAGSAATSAGVREKPASGGDHREQDQQDH